MAGAGPYMESNEPYNPIPGLAAGAIIGGGMTGLGVGATMSTINGVRAGRERIRDSKVSQKEQGVSKMKEAALNMQGEAFEGKPYSGGTGQSPVNKNTPNEKLSPGSTARNYIDLREQIGQEESAIEELKSKKFKPKISGGRMAGVIGGTALAGAIIGGTAGAMGNYD